MCDRVSKSIVVFGKLHILETLTAAVPAEVLKLKIQVAPFVGSPDNLRRVAMPEPARRPSSEEPPHGDRLYKRGCFGRGGYGYGAYGEYG